MQAATAKVSRTAGLTDMHPNRHLFSWRRFRAGIIGLFILVLILLALQPTLSVTRLRTTLEILASQALGRPVSCTALRFTFSLTPRVTLENLMVGASPDEPQLRIGRAVVQPRLWPLLTGRRIQLEQVVLDGVHLQLAETKPASPSPEKAVEPEPVPPEPEATAPTSFTLDEIGFFRLTGLSVSRRAKDGVETNLLEVPELSGALPAGEGVTLHGRVRVAGQTWSVHGQTDGRPDDTPEEPPRWQAQAWMISAPAHHVMIDVAVENGAPGPEVTVQLRLQGEQVDDLWVMDQLKQHPHGPYRLQGTLVWTPGQLNGDNWTWELGPIQGTGFARVTMKPGAEPELTASIQGGPLVLKDWVAPAEEEPGWQVSGAQATLQATTRGRTSSAWLEHLRGGLTLREVVVTRPLPGKDDVRIRVDHLQLQRADTGTALQLLGNLAGIPADLHARVTSEHPRQWNVSMQGHLGQDPLTVDGRVAAVGATYELDARLEVAGEKVDTFLPWLHVDAGARADLPYRLQAGFALRRDQLRFDVHDLQLGSSQLRARVSVPRGTAAGPKQWMLEAERLNIDEWKDLAASLKTTRSDLETEASGVMLLDTQIFPTGLVLDDADVEVRVARLDAGLHHVQDLSCQAHVRNGKIPSAPFRFRVGVTRFDGAVELDASGKEPCMALNAEARDVDVRALVGQYQYETGYPLRADRFSAVIRARGNRLGELLQSGYLSLDAEGVQGIAPHPLGGEDLVFTMDHVGVHLHQGQPLELRLNAQLRKVPVEATLVLNREVPRTGLGAGDTMWLPMEFDISSPGVQWSGRGFLPLPFDLANMDLELDLGGDRLDRLSPVLGLSLPDLGPYQARGRMSFVDGTLLLDELDVTVGSSRLSGRIDMQPLRTPEVWRIEAASSHLQLTDFSTLWAPEEEEASAVEAVPDAAPPWYDRMGGLSLNLDVMELRMGEDDWGSGSVALSGRNALLRLDRMDVDGPQGRIDLVLEQGRVKDRRHLRVKGTVEDLQLGAISRLLMHQDLDDAASSGELTVAVNLWEQADPATPPWSGLAGELAFSLVPRDLSSSLFDLWAAGLVRSVLPTLAQQPSPQFNCVTGSLTARDGQLRVRRLELDTTRIRVKGKGGMDLVQRQLDLTLKPRPKQLTFISLATPVEVHGTLEDPEIKVKAKSLVTTFFKMYVWVITAFQSLFSEPIPHLQGPACSGETMQELDVIMGAGPGPESVP